MAFVEIPVADFYDCADQDELAHEHPEDAIEEYLDIFMDKDTKIMDVIEQYPITIYCYNINKDLEPSADYDVGCDLVQEIDIPAEQVETMMRKHCPEWFEEAT